MKQRSETKIIGKDENGNEVGSLVDLNKKLKEEVE
jgi:hypothetical protein